MMVVSLDRLCNRYHVLPSYAINKADTFDMWVMDVSLRYDRIQQQKKDGTYDPNEHYSESELMDILKQVKKKDDTDI